VERHQLAHPQILPRGGWVEHSPDTWNRRTGRPHDNALVWPRSLVVYDATA
jgi:glycerol kinase